jgi:hypothetical protein
MRLLAKYREHAQTFARLAADEHNPALKTHFENQADAYRKLAAERSRKLGVLVPLDWAGAKK